jgi:hypothetical protein
LWDIAGMKDREKEDQRMRQVLFYRDYIVSNLWEIRKFKYYERHAKACKICGATKNVQLNHIKYGNYGNEIDRDLVPLCGDHHQELHDTIGVRKNMHYQTEHFLEKMIAKWDGEHEVAPLKAIAPVKSSPSGFAKAVDRVARPIWRLFGVRR